MNEFVFLYRGGLSDGKQPSPKEMEEQMKLWQVWGEELGREGRLKDFGQPLQRAGKIVAKGGAITDGPFAGGKEIIGGYSIVKAKDLTEAATIAKGCPVFNTGGYVEVRPVQAM